MTLNKLRTKRDEGSKYGGMEWESLGVEYELENERVWVGKANAWRVHVKYSELCSKIR